MKKHIVFFKQNLKIIRTKSCYN